MTINACRQAELSFLVYHFFSTAMQGFPPGKRVEPISLFRSYPLLFPFSSPNAITTNTLCKHVSLLYLRRVLTTILKGQEQATRGFKIDPHKNKFTLRQELLSKTTGHKSVIEREVFCSICYKTLFLPWSTT